MYDNLTEKSQKEMEREKGFSKSDSFHIETDACQAPGNENGAHLTNKREKKPHVCGVLDSHSPTQIRFDIEHLSDDV